MTPPEPVLSFLEVKDPELLVTGVRGARLQPCQLSACAMASTLGRVWLPSACLDLVHIGPAMCFAGEMPRDCYTIMFVLACPQPGHSFNFSRVHTDGYVGFWPPGGSLDAATPEGYANATLTVPVDDFHGAVSRNYSEIPEKVLKCGAGVRVGPKEEAAFRRLIEEVDHALRHVQDSIAGECVRRHLQDELLAAFLDALRSGCINGEPPPTVRLSSRMRRMRQARDFIAAHLHEPLCLDDLCRALGLSRRGVENLFQNLLGINPITFLRHNRLHGVRRALSEAEPGSGIVKKAALEWGFRHLGRFAGEYRALFGESPNATLVRQQRAL
jgi:AraC-like DNA-binding protein